LVGVLVEGEMEAGMHSVNWNGGAVPSGVYLYRLEGEGWGLERKMVMEK
jgi:hypothetical protein